MGIPSLYYLARVDKVQASWPSYLSVEMYSVFLVGSENLVGASWSKVNMPQLDHMAAH